MVVSSLQLIDHTQKKNYNSLIKLTSYQPHSVWSLLPVKCIEQKINSNSNSCDSVYGAVIVALPLREFTRFIWRM